MSEKCPHVGVNHPIKFDCLDCEDNAMDCNCNSCNGVFCQECGRMYFNIECQEVVDAWEEKHPGRDLHLEAMMLQGKIKGYKTEEVKK